MEQAVMKKDIWDHLAELPPEIIMAVIFLMFFFQLIKLGADYLYRSKKDRAKRQEEENNNGVNHLTIFEKLGEHNGLLERVEKVVDKMDGSLEKLENDFRLHTQSDADMANSLLRRLDRIDNKLDK